MLFTNSYEAMRSLLDRAKLEGSKARIYATRDKEIMLYYAKTASKLGERPIAFSSDGSMYRLLTVK